MTDRRVDPCPGVPVIVAWDGCTIGWRCPVCEWEAPVVDPTLEQLDAMRRGHNPGTAIEERWYVVNKGGRLDVVWSGAAEAIRLATDWPSLTETVLHLHGTAHLPVVDVIWRNDQ